MKPVPSEPLSPKAAEIAAHAKVLLAAGSYDSFSYADISERVRISKASIHHHFASKSELVRFVVAQYREEAQRGMASIDQHIVEPLGRLNAYLDYWSKCLRDGTATFCICAMLAAELPILPSEIAGEVRGHFEDLIKWLASVLKKGVATGQFHLTGTPAIEARAFMAAVHGAMLSARAFGDAEAFRVITHLAVKKLSSAA